MGGIPQDVGMETGDRIKQRRKHLGLTQMELAKACGWDSQSRVSQYEKKKRVPALSDLRLLAKALKIEVSELVSDSPPETVKTDAVPLISWVTAGQFETAADPFEPGDAEEWLPCPASHGPHAYALRVQGDSMTAPYGRSYPDGCVIFVDPEKRTPANGARIIAKLEGSDQVTFKCFQQDAGRIWLKPLNPQHPPIMEPFKVIGTVIGKWEPE